MARLSPSTNIGGNVSSLIRSAGSITNQINAYNDSLQAFQYQNSAFTDDAYTAYKTYLQDRIDTLQKAGTIADAQKALTLTKTLEAATHSNISAAIQRENIQILSGNATKMDKYNLISNEYVRAVNNGDLSLAQSLESQAYSLSQSIQYDQQQAASSAQTLAKASASAGAQSQKELIDTLQHQVDTFNTDYAHAGQKSANSTVDAFVKQITPTLNALGIHLDPGVKPNYFDIVSGVNQAIFNALGHEAQLYQSAGDTASYNSTIDKMNSVVSSIKTNYGTMNAAQLEAAANNPNLYSYNAAPDYQGQPKGGPGGQINPQVGYAINPKTNNVEPVRAQSAWVNVPVNLQNQIQSAGLTVVGGKDEGGLAYTVIANKNAPPQIKKILAGNATSEAVATYDNNGNPTGFQVESDAQHGTGMAVYSFAKNGQIYESSNLGDRLIYDPTQPNQPNTHYLNNSFGMANATHNLKSWFGPLADKIGSLFTGHASAQDLINSGQLTEYQIAKANAAAAAAMLAAKPAPLPQITIAPPAPLPAIHQPSAGPSAALPSYPVAPKAPAPQNPNFGVGQQSSGQLQGGGFNLMTSGGGGIRL